MAFGIYFGQVIVCLAFVAFDVLICILLMLENKQAAKLLEEIGKTQPNTCLRISPSILLIKAFQSHTYLIVQASLNLA